MTYYICILLLAVCSCGYFGYQPSPHIEHANKLAARCSRAYKNEYQLVQIASGGGMMDGIECIVRDFESSRKIGVEEGRRLFVNGIELFCSMFNQDLTIRPYLRNYPFGQKNIHLTLAFVDPIYFNPYPRPYVSLIFCEHGIIFYRAYNPQTQDYGDFYHESYEEAVRIVHEERKAAAE